MTGRYHEPFVPWLVEPAVGRAHSIGGAIGHHRPIIAHRRRGSDVLASVVA